MGGAGGNATEEGIIQMGGDEAVDEGFSSRGGEAVSNFSNVAELEV